MFRKASDKKTFTALDIRRYIDGLMSPAERNELERAAFSDPLLEDALEGYASQSPDKTREDLRDLRSRLAHRVRPGERKPKPVLPLEPRQPGQPGNSAQRNAWMHPWARIRPETWLRAAAALVILAGAAILLYIHNRPSGIRPPLALESRKVQLSPAPPLIPAPSAHVASAPAAPGTPAPSAHVVPTPSTPLVPAPSTHVIPAPSAPAVPVPNTLESKVAGVSVYPAAGSSRPALADVQVSPYARRRDTLFDKIPHPVQYQNKVTDPFNRPISGAVVRVLPWGTAATTDKTGSFNIGSGIVDSNATVSIEAVGYVSETYPVNRLRDSPAIQLKAEANALVIGYGTDKKKAMVRLGSNAAVAKVSDSNAAAAKDSAIETDTTEAQPIGGWSAFYRYISDNKDNDIYGEVILSFRVNRKGKPADIVVEKSGGASCDMEARRLLQKGPRWTKKDKGRVSIRF